jgi:hypothetical protein
MSDYTTALGAERLRVERDEFLALSIARTVMLERNQARARVAQLEATLAEAILALDAATTIGKRSCSPRDHLHYANHDRIVRDGRALLDTHIKDG